jgi:hypothetical protein
MDTSTTRPLTEAERGWVDAQVNMAAFLVGAACPDLAGGAVTLDALDRGFRVWAEAARRAPLMAQSGLQAFGVALGRVLVDNLGFAWCVVEANGRTELAVTHGDGAQLVRPVAHLEASWARGEAPSFAETYAALERALWAARRRGADVLDN